MRGGGGANTDFEWYGVLSMAEILQFNITSTKTIIVRIRITKD